MRDAVRLRTFPTRHNQNDHTVFPTSVHIGQGRVGHCRARVAIQASCETTPTFRRMHLSTSTSLPTAEARAVKDGSTPGRAATSHSSTFQGLMRIQGPSSAHLAGAGGDAGEETAGSELLVQERVQLAVGLALGQLALDVVGLGGDLERVARGAQMEATVAPGRMRINGTETARKNVVWPSAPPSPVHGEGGACANQALHNSSRENMTKTTLDEK